MRHNAVHRQPGHAGEGALDVGHLAAIRRIERAAVAHLPAGFGVEGGLVEHQLRLRAGRNLVRQLAVDEQAEHARCGLHLLISQELGAPMLQ